jgi:anti-sigma regulatory factor (Ser/Thr protein kinase)
VETVPEQLVLATALPSLPTSASKARGVVARAFVGLPETLLDDAQLLVSEAVSNAIKHSEQPADVPIRLSGYLAGSRARIEVADEGPGLTRDAVRDGFGFRIFDEIATAWGVGQIDGRSTTWFELETQPTSGRRSA